MVMSIMRPFGIDRQRRLGHELGDVLVGEQRVGGDRKHRTKYASPGLQRLQTRTTGAGAAARWTNSPRRLRRASAMPADASCGTREGGVATGTVIAGTGKGSAGRRRPFELGRFSP
jgi:hypothetical protein